MLLLRESDKISEKGKEYLDFIDTSTDRMESLIVDTLDYAISGSKNLTAEFVDIHTLVTEKLNNIKFPNKDKGVIHLNLPKTKIKVYKQLIGLVFYNLVNNGIKFNNSEIPTVKVDFSESKNFWNFTVEDNGIGIDYIYAEEIFKPFIRISKKKTEGTGIGLSICKRVVSLHNGEIGLEKTPEGNTVFKFSISKHL